MRLDCLSFEKFDESRDGETIYFIPSKDTMNWFLEIPKKHYENHFDGRESISGLELLEIYKTK